MTKKKLVFDVVFVYGDENVFELRFKKLNKHVDLFLIFGKKEVVEKIIKLYSLIEHKIKIFPFDMENLNYDTLTTYILETIEKEYNSFEDIIIFSYPFEIPEIESLSENDLKSKDVNILLSDVYENNLTKKRLHPEGGSIVVNFSHLQKNRKNFLEEIFNLKKKPTFDTAIKNGLKIINYNIEEKNESKTYKCPYSKKTFEYKNKGDERKFLVNLGGDIPDYECDFLLNLNFSSEFPEKLEIDFTKKLQHLDIFLPRQKLYDVDTEIFSLNYKLNEVNRILSVFNCQENDDVEIYLNNEIVKKVKFNKIKNPS